ncbi:MAG: sterol desaturase family protein [Williamsia sp.]|nr:sterol desaturase family protein [Williamsia sp.]
MIKSIFDNTGTFILVGLFSLLFLLEMVSQLRRRTQPKIKRIVLNFILSLPAFALLRLLLIPAMVWLAGKNESWHAGLNYLYKAPAWVEGALAFILLDYTNYLWHILNHKWSLLWRFHLVHHIDLDLDVTTALRFHFGEIIGSVFFRGAAVLLTGASPLVVLVYEIVFEAATQFHHSNICLPLQLEQALSKLIVTPRMHGIHHSVFRNETDSNFSVIFSGWDRLHKTFRLHIPQHPITIGVPSYQNPQELTIGYLLKLPFTRIRKWGKKYEHRETKPKAED